MKIYTVIPLYSDRDVYLNEVISFREFVDAEYYASNNIAGKNYEIVESILK